MHGDRTRGLALPAPCLALVAIVLCCAGVAAAASSDYVGHPKLLFGQEDIPALQHLVTGNSTNAREFRALQNRVQGYLNQPPDSLLTYLAGLSTVPELGLVTQLRELVYTDASPHSFAPIPIASPPPTAGSKLREVVLHLARSWDVDSDDYNSSLRLRALALGYDMAFGEASVAERQEVRDEILAYLTFMPSRFEYYRYLENPFTSNRGVMVGAAIGLAAISIWDDVTSAERMTLGPILQFGYDMVLHCISDILASDGSYREGVLYGAWMFRMAIPYVEAQRRFTGLDLATIPGIDKAATWLCFEVLPEGGGRTNNMNDSLWLTRPLAVHNTYLDWAQYRFASPLAKYLEQHVTGDYGYDAGAQADKVATVLWNRDIPAVNPVGMLADGELFVDRGVYYYRSGWKPGAIGSEVLFSFFSGVFHGGHAQEDQNQFTLYAHGDRYALDHGSQYLSVVPKESVAHNIVLIDQLGQHNAGNSIGTDGSIAESMLTSFADYICGDATSAYTTHSPLNDPDVPFPGVDWSWGYDGGNPVQRARRFVVCVKGTGAPVYFLIADDIRKDDDVHQYDWLLHTDLNNAVDTAMNPVRIIGSQSEMRLYFGHPTPAQGLSFVLAPFAHGGQDPETTLLRARVTAVEPAFFVALVPLAAAQLPPTHVVNSFGNAAELQLGWAAVQDNVAFSPQGTYVPGTVGADARIALVRAGVLGVLGYVMVEGTVLQYAGQLLLQLSGAANAILADGVLYLSRDDVEFLAWGENIDKVMGPNGPIPFVRGGGVVYSVTITDAPAEFSSAQAPTLRVSQPNPFAGMTRLTFGVGQPGMVRLRIFDLRGRLVRTLTERRYSGGEASVFWDGTDDRGRRQAAGVYLLRLESGGMKASRKLIFVR